MRTVHYMCRKPGDVCALVYPFETDDSYQGSGSFFLAGGWEDDVDDAYNFQTLLGDGVAYAKLVREHGSMFAAVIDGIGRFRFRASTTGIPARYAATARLAEGPLLVRQLIPQERRRLETAAIENGFVFLGHSPRLEDDGGTTPRPPTGLTPTPRSQARRRRPEPSGSG